MISHSGWKMLSLGHSLLVTGHLQGKLCIDRFLANTSPWLAGAGSHSHLYGLHWFSVGLISNGTQDQQDVFRILTTL